VLKETTSQGLCGLVCPSLRRDLEVPGGAGATFVGHVQLFLCGHRAHGAHAVNADSEEDSE